MPADRHTKARTIPTLRSRVSNGTSLLANIDGRSSLARRFRDLVESFEADLGGPSLTEVERGLIRQAAALTLRSEQLQADMVNGQPVDGDQLIRLTGTAKRILQAITVKASKRKPSAPTLADYAAQKFAGEAEQSAVEVADGEAP
jgi:hypothetical protein